MTVADLIAHLQSMPQHFQVAVTYEDTYCSVDDLRITVDEYISIRYTQDNVVVGAVVINADNGGGYRT